MSYVWKTIHPMVRRQHYLERRAAARREYFRRHPDELDKLRALALVLTMALVVLLAYCSGGRG